jgi:hypothetical protein
MLIAEMLVIVGVLIVNGRLPTAYSGGVQRPQLHESMPCFDPNPDSVNRHLSLSTLSARRRRICEQGGGPCRSGLRHPDYDYAVGIVIAGSGVQTDERLPRTYPSLPILVLLTVATWVL